jgi:hypothetical protein
MPPSRLGVLQEAEALSTVSAKLAAVKLASAPGSIFVVGAAGPLTSSAPVAQESGAFVLEITNVLPPCRVSPIPVTNVRRDRPY